MSVSVYYFYDSPPVKTLNVDSVGVEQYNLGSEFAGGSVSYLSSSSEVPASHLDKLLRMVADVGIWVVAGGLIVAVVVALCLAPAS